VRQFISLVCRVIKPLFLFKPLCPSATQAHALKQASNWPANATGGHWAAVYPVFTYIVDSAKTFAKTFAVTTLQLSISTRQQVTVLAAHIQSDRRTKFDAPWYINRGTRPASTPFERLVFRSGCRVRQCQDMRFLRVERELTCVIFMSWTVKWRLCARESWQ
jgi:hypothetical protein